jgi:misacylated tRNA(Ala) deacylase
MTEQLYLYDHYLKEFDASIIETFGNSGVVLDRTALYPRGGGQPSDRGKIIVGDSILEVLESSKSEESKIVHIVRPLSPDLSSLVGRRAHGVIDWDYRYKLMRHHTALHIISGVVYHRFGSKITGGQIYPERARLDFPLGDMSKERLALILEESNKLVAENRSVKTLWLATDEALRNKDLYRLSVDLLPKGLNKLRIVEIEGFDAQLDGGTHVARTGEIGRIEISKTENKGKENKRIEIVLH